MHVFAWVHARVHVCIMEVRGWQEVVFLSCSFFYILRQHVYLNLELMWAQNSMPLPREYPAAKLSQGLKLIWIKGKKAIPWPYAMPTRRKTTHKIPSTQDRFFFFCTWDTKKLRNYQIKFLLFKVQGFEPRASDHARWAPYHWATFTVYVSLFY